MCDAFLPVCLIKVAGVTFYCMSQFVHLGLGAAEPVIAAGV